MSLLKIGPDGSGVEYFTGSNVVLDGDIKPGPKRNPMGSKSFSKRLLEKDSLEEIEEERRELKEAFGSSFF